MNLSGWLFDVFEDPADGAAVWLLGDDGRRLRLRQRFPAALCVRGEDGALAALQNHLSQRFPHLLFRPEIHRDVFERREVEVLAVEAPRVGELPAVLRAASRAFPTLEYANADLAISLRYAARTGIAPLGRCRLEVDGQGWIQECEALDSPWDLDHGEMPLRTLYLQCEETRSGRGSEAARLLAVWNGKTSAFPLRSPRALLNGLAGLLTHLDPDLIMAERGDTWLLPHLIELSAGEGIDLPLNREPHNPIARRKERWYYSYGQLIYRGQQVLLQGRWHIDGSNAMFWEDYDLEGVFELARITGLPVQTSARVSPGTGISSAQILTALRLGILVPWQKQQPEMMKSAADLFTADQGGLVFQPRIGLHRDVYGLDFVSMYPAIMVNNNISPETVGVTPQPDAARVPEVNLWIDMQWPGLVPQALAPLLQRRIGFKNALLNPKLREKQRSLLKKRSSALKWLLVTCFGYLGYKNARFGRIEAHQAVTAYGREALLSAKEAAEDAGYEVIQLYVDGMWIKGKGSCSPQELCDEIFRRTGLLISLDGHYRWVAFLPSRVHHARSAANRYFGSFEDGSLKVRGIDARRHDTPRFISRTQMEILELLATYGDPDEGVQAALAHLRHRLLQLRRGRVPLEQLLVTHKLSREPQEYKANSPAARAARQLLAAGVEAKPGQRMRFLYTLGDPGVWAWEQPGTPPAASLDIARYEELSWRAAAAVLGPMTGKDEFQLRTPSAPELPFPRRRPALLPRKTAGDLPSSTGSAHVLRKQPPPLTVPPPAYNALTTLQGQV